MLVAILRAHGLDVFTNLTGSNFTWGVISSMLGEPSCQRGRLQADMAVLEPTRPTPSPADAVKPTHALLLNVARDHSTGSPRSTTACLLASLAEQTTDGVVLNIDDLFICASVTASATRSPCATSASTTRSPNGCPVCRSRTSGSTTTSRPATGP